MCSTSVCICTYTRIIESHFQPREHYKLKKKMKKKKTTTKKRKKSKRDVLSVSSSSSTLILYLLPKLVNSSLNLPPSLDDCLWLKITMHKMRLYDMTMLINGSRSFKLPFSSHLLEHTIHTERTVSHSPLIFFPNNLM